MKGKVTRVPRGDIGRLLEYFAKCNYQKSYTAKYVWTKSGGHYRLKKLSKKMSKFGTPLCNILEEVILPKEREMFGVERVEDLPKWTGPTQKEIDRERRAKYERRISAQWAEKYTGDVNCMYRRCIPYYVKHGEWPFEYYARLWSETMAAEWDEFQSIAESERAEHLERLKAKHSVINS